MQPEIATMLRTSATEGKYGTKAFVRGMPMFMTIDREKIKFVKDVFLLGVTTVVEGEKSEIGMIPKYMYAAAMNAAKTEEDAARMRKINEQILDQHIVGNAGRAFDQAIKKKAMKLTGLRDGLAIISGTGLAFTEHEHGSARDLKKALKATLMKIHEASMDGVNSINSILPSFLPIPFLDSKLGYGNWGRPSPVDENIDEPNFYLPASIIKAKAIKLFEVADKVEPGFWSSDITEKVQAKVTESGMPNGYAVVTTFHTTVGITKTRPSDIPALLSDLEVVAPFSADQYYHNKLEERGRLKCDQEGEPLGDGNGWSHVVASLTGSYTVAKVVDGRLELADGERIMHFDYDTLEPRGRNVAVTMIEQK